MAKSNGKTLSETAYERLRTDIVCGRLAPDAKLRIEELRQDYDTGASPLREALSRLAGEGFVTAEGQRGFRVAPISLADLDEITRLRIMLECEALRESIAKGTDAWESDLVATFHHLAKVEGSARLAPDVLEWEMRNHAFHEALIAACDSSWLLRFRRTLFEQHKRYRLISILDDASPRDVHAEHETIFRAALARNADAACAATESHIQRTADITRAAFKRFAEEAAASAEPA